MSAELISMEEWQKAKFLDWSGRYIDALLSRMTLRERTRLVRNIERTLADHAVGQSAPAGRLKTEE